MWESCLHASMFLSTDSSSPDRCLYPSLSMDWKFIMAPDSRGRGAKAGRWSKCETAIFRAASAQGLSHLSHAHIHLCDVYRSILQDASCPSLVAGQPAGLHRSTERRAQVSSCELLRSLDAARGSVDCYEVPCHSEKHQQGGVAQRRASASPASLRKPARRIGGCMWRLACDSHLH